MAFCPVASSPTVLDFLLSIFAWKGYPVELISDHGPQFTYQEFEPFPEDRGIKHSLSAVYHSQVNGQVERFNRALEYYIQLAMLKQCQIKNTVTEYLGIYRATFNSSTGLSSAVLLHSRHMRTSMDAIGYPTANYFADPIQEMSSLQKRVKERQRKSRNCIDRRRAARVPKFQVRKVCECQEDSPRFERHSHFWTFFENFQANRTLVLLP